MTWELRGTNRYYYEGTRVGGKVKKVYLGSGASAQLATERHEKISQERSELRALELVVAPSEQLMRELDEAVRLVSHASLLAANYHQHRGNWRKYRD